MEKISNVVELKERINIFQKIRNFREIQREKPDGKFFGFNWKIFLFFLLGFFFSFAFGSKARAATYYWVGGTTDSKVSNPANWKAVSSGSCGDYGNTFVPGAGDVVYFTAACSNNASVDMNWTLSSFYLSNGYSGIVTADNVTMSVVSVLNISSGSLIVSGGGSLTPPSATNGFIIGGTVGQTGRLTITGSGTVLNHSTGRMRVGDTGIGYLNVLDGAILNSSGQLYSGYATGSKAYITVDGAGTVVNIETAGLMGYVGRQGYASLTISNGAVYNSGANPLHVGSYAGSTGSVTVTGAGSKLNLTNTYADARIGASGNGSLNVSDGGSVFVADRMRIADLTGSSGTLTIGSGYTLDVVEFNSDEVYTSALEVGVGTVISPPLGVGSVSGLATSDTSIFWDWNDISGATSYKVYDASNDSLLATIDSDTSEWEQNSLTPVTSYSIYVRGVNDNGEGYASDTVTVSTIPVPSAPTNVSAVAGEGQATITFTSPTFDGGSPIIGYKVTSNPGSFVCTTDVSSCVVTGLDSGTSYTFSVVATSSVGDSAPSMASNGVTPDPIVALGAPMNLVATDDYRRVSLSWEVPVSDGDSPITDYVAEYKRTFAHEWVTFDDGISDQTNVVVTGLVGGAKYDFRVSAVNSSGIGKPSANVIATSNSQSITISSPVRYQIIQRDIVSGRGSMTVSGSYLGYPASIEASWNGSEYQTIVTNPSGGTFSGTLVNLSPGQGELSVRIADDAGVFSTISDIGIGDLFVVSGQSNTDGRGPVHGYTHSVSGVGASIYSGGVMPNLYNTWQDLQDRSYLPDLASFLLERDPNVPIGFIKRAQAGEPISSFIPNTLPGWTIGGCGSTEYGNGCYAQLETAFLTATQGQSPKVRALLWYQGENDTMINTSASDYLGRWNAILDGLRGLSDNSIVGMVGVIGTDNYTVTTTPAQSDLIRNTQISVHAQSNNLPGAIMVDNRGNGLHYDTETSLRQMGYRWYQAVAKYIYGVSGMDANPKVEEDSVRYDPGSNKISLRFDSELASGADLIDIDDNGAGTVGLPSGAAFNIFTDAETTSSYAEGESYIRNVSLGADNKTVTLTLAEGVAINDSSKLSYCSDYNGKRVAGTMHNGASTGTAYTSCAGGNSFYSRNDKMVAYPFYDLNIRSTAAPGKPTNISARAGDRQATVSFSNPTDDGGSDITGYTVISNPDNIIATGSASPIVVTGLTNGVEYSFTVTATNDIGDSLASEPSNNVVPAIVSDDAEKDKDNSESDAFIPNEDISSEEDEKRDLDISDVNFEAGIDSLTIRWKTDRKAESVIRYGMNRELKEKENDKEKEKNHKKIIRGLLPGTEYHFRIRSEDGDGNSDRSRIYSVRTLPKMENKAVNRTYSQNRVQLPDQQEKDRALSDDHIENVHIPDQQSQSQVENRPSNQSPEGNFVWWKPRTWQNGLLKIAAKIW